MPRVSPSEESKDGGSGLNAEIGAAAPSIPVFDLRIEQEDLDAVEAVLRSGWWTMGPRVADFERIFAEHLGTAHVVATSSCTTALHLALLGAGVGPGDEVIVPSYTFVATVATVMQTGATPIFAEIGGQQIDTGGTDQDIYTVGIGLRYDFSTNSLKARDRSGPAFKQAAGFGTPMNFLF